MSQHYEITICHSELTVGLIGTILWHMKCVAFNHIFLSIHLKIIFFIVLYVASTHSLIAYLREVEESRLNADKIV